MKIAQIMTTHQRYFCSYSSSKAKRISFMYIYVCVYDFMVQQHTYSLFLFFSFSLFISRLKFSLTCHYVKIRLVQNHRKEFRLSFFIFRATIYDLLLSWLLHRKTFFRLNDEKHSTSEKQSEAINICRERKKYTFFDWTSTRKKVYWSASGKILLFFFVIPYDKYCTSKVIFESIYIFDVIRLWKTFS